jgi:hypothetical protein
MSYKQCYKLSHHDPDHRPVGHRMDMATRTVPSKLFGYNCPKNSVCCHKLNITSLFFKCSTRHEVKSRARQRTATVWAGLHSKYGSSNKITWFTDQQKIRETTSMVHHEVHRYRNFDLHNCTSVDAGVLPRGSVEWRWVMSDPSHPTPFVLVSPSIRPSRLCYYVAPQARVYRHDSTPPLRFAENCLLNIFVRSARSTGEVKRKSRRRQWTICGQTRSIDCFWMVDDRTQPIAGWKETFLLVWRQLI